MKIVPFKTPKSDKATILFQDDRNKKPYAQLHQHAELQITWVEKGQGNMLVGDSFESFKRGDVFLFGAHLPHVFKSEKKCSMVSIFFTENSFGFDFFKLKEFRKIRSLFDLAQKGIRVKSNTGELFSTMNIFEKSAGASRIIQFLAILKLVSESRKGELSVFAYNKQFNANEAKRMSAVFDYTLKNYAKEIKLEEVAAQCMLSKNAFCKYFKQRTNKTFFQFLIEVRIEKVCEAMLKENNSNMSEIAYAVGFNNLSNFNRQFKKIKLMTPREFLAKAQSVS